MRRILVTAATVMVALLVPTDASAKGAAGLTISGGGLDEPLEVDVNDETMEAIVEQTHFYDSLWEPGVHALTSDAPSRHLGPRVVLSWDMDHDGSALGPDVPFVQTVYPLARGGPIVHTDDGQQIYLEPVAGGWHRADRRLVVTLRRLGAVAPILTRPRVVAV